MRWLIQRDKERIGRGSERRKIDGLMLMKEEGRRKDSGDAVFTLCKRAYFSFTGSTLGTRYLDRLALLRVQMPLNFIGPRRPSFLVGQKSLHSPITSRRLLSILQH